jgi:hypothetical protein
MKCALLVSHTKPKSRNEEARGGQQGKNPFFRRPISMMKQCSSAFVEYKDQLAA